MASYSVLLLCCSKENPVLISSDEGEAHLPKVVGKRTDLPRASKRTGPPGPLRAQVLEGPLTEPPQLR